MRRPRFIGIPIVLFGIVALGIVGLITMALWNALMPPLFRLSAINFWQALGLFLLSRVLFGRFGGGGWKRRPHFVRGWKGLTVEERDRFRRAMASRDTQNFGDSDAADKL